MVGVVAAPALAAGANWFAATLGLSTYANTAFLRAGGSAASLTLTRIGGATAIGTLVELRRVPLDLLAEQLRVHAVHFTLPAVCLFLANFFNSISLARCGITLTYVTKAAGPVATIVLCRLGLGELPAARALLAIPLVIVGVALSVWGNAEFEPLGFGAACASTAFQTLLGISGKNAIVRSGVSGQSAHWLMCAMVLTASAAHMGARTLTRGVGLLAAAVGRGVRRRRAAAQARAPPRLGGVDGGDGEPAAARAAGGWPRPRTPAPAGGAAARRSAAPAISRAMRAAATALRTMRSPPAPLPLPPPAPSSNGDDARSAPDGGAPSARAALGAGSVGAATGSPVDKPRAAVRVRGPLPPRVRILPLWALRLLAPVAFYAEYSLMFSYAAKVDSLTLSVWDTVRRSAIVYWGRLLFGGDRLLPVNVAGILAALTGATLYALLAATR